MGGIVFMLLVCELTTFCTVLAEHFLSVIGPSRYNGVGIVRYLMSLVDPMAGNNDGWNSLHIACL